MAASYKVHGIHYEGVPSSIGTIKIVSGMIDRTPTNTSHPYDKSMPIHHYIIKEAGQDLVLLGSSGNPNRFKFTLEDWREYGPASTQIDEFGFASWVRGSKPPAMNEYVILPTEIIAVESFHDMPWQAPTGQPPLQNKHTKKFYVSIINRAGPELSRLENSRQRVRRYDETNISEAIAEGSGKFSGSIDYLVIGGLPEGAAYGIGRAEDGGIVLAVAHGLYEKAALIARELGIPVESYFQVLVAEEHRHRVRRSFDKRLGIEGRIKEEEGTKEDVHAKLEELADGAKGDPRTRYRRAQQILENQSKTMGRMKTTVWSDYRELYSRDKASLAKMLYMDALEEGLKGEAAERYVSEYLAKIRDDVEGKDTSRTESTSDREGKDGRREATREPAKEDPREPATADASANN